MIAAPVNKILPYSVVDGPGCRAVVFLQRCNLSCLYCHNPETLNLCISCGECVGCCPAGALELRDGEVIWDVVRCEGCDQCVRVCPHQSSPKVKPMTPGQVLAKVLESRPFIRGLTTSGGECSLYPEFLERLYALARSEGLTCLMDSNGAVDLSQYPQLMRVCDGVMLDVKAWREDVFRRLTGGDVRIVRKNVELLSREGKLAEVRVVVLPGYVDAEECIDGTAGLLGPDRARCTPLKLIRFRHFGVRGELMNEPSPPVELMERLRNRALADGFKHITIL